MHTAASRTITAMPLQLPSATAPAAAKASVRGSRMGSVGHLELIKSQIIRSSTAMLQSSCLTAFQMMLMLAEAGAMAYWSAGTQ